MPDMMLSGRLPTVLVIDDDSFSRSTVRAMLSVQGVSNTYTACDGRDGVRAIEGMPKEPDFVILDIFMPNMDGLEVINELAKRGYRGGLILVSSGDVNLLQSAGILATERSLNLLGIFEKPLSVKSLLQAMRYELPSIPPAPESAINSILIEELNRSIDAVILADEKGGIVLFNAAAEELFARPAASAIGQDLFHFIRQFFGEDYSRSVRNPGHGAAKPRADGRFTPVVCRRADGAALAVEAVMVNSEKGNGYKFTVIWRRSTAQLQAETDYSLLEAQLYESQKMSALGVLASGIAHDFNNTLGTILVNASIALKDAEGQPAVLLSIAEINKSGMRARELVKQILDFGRRQPDEKKCVNLTSLVEDAARLLRSLLPPPVSLAVHCDAATPAVLANGAQLTQVLINLANNAMQAMQGGPGQITLRLDAVRLDAALVETHPELYTWSCTCVERVVRLSVADDGAGMDAATLRKIFEPFFTTKSENGGTGLGLSVVHGIVRVHQGVITVRSEPGRGATFTIYLPAVEAPQRESVGLH